MSFILDALKKSESERHRQSGPVLMDVRIAAPRRRIPIWAWVIAVVLLVNFAVLAWILWLSPAHRTVSAPPVQAAIPTAPAAAMPVAATPVVAAPATTPAPDPAATPAVVPPQVTATPAQAPVAVQIASASQPTAPAGYTTPQNIDASTLPKVADMLAAGVALPELQLSLHVYDASPQNRYVLLNGSRMKEGDFTPEGVRVIAITPTGLVVEWRGRRMFLGSGG